MGALERGGIYLSRTVNNGVLVRVVDDTDSWLLAPTIDAGLGLLRVMYARLKGKKHSRLLLGQKMVTTTEVENGYQIVVTSGRRTLAKFMDYQLHLLGSLVRYDPQLVYKAVSGVTVLSGDAFLQSYSRVTGDRLRRRQSVYAALMATAREAVLVKRVLSIWLGDTGNGDFHRTGNQHGPGSEASQDGEGQRWRSDEDEERRRSRYEDMVALALEADAGGTEADAW